MEKNKVNIMPMLKLGYVRKTELEESENVMVFQSGVYDTEEVKLYKNGKALTEQYSEQKNNWNNTDNPKLTEALNEVLNQWNQTDL